MIISEEQKEYGFWRKNKANNFPPEAIVYPHEYKGQKSVNIFCSQNVDLMATEQRKLIKEWVNFLPTCKNLEFIWFSSRVSQEIFDSVCTLENIKGLYIKWSGVRELNNITKLKNLKYLYIGSSGSIKTIEPLSLLRGLEVLDLEEFKKVSDFSCISKLTKLRFLSIKGGFSSMQKVDSLVWIKSLQDLIFASFAAIRLGDKNISPIFELKKLENLNLPLDLSPEDINYLKSQLPKLKYFPNRYYEQNMKKIKESSR